MRRAGFRPPRGAEDDAVAELAAALDAFEGEISAQRHEVFAELDDLTEELVRRYREQRRAGDDEW